MEGARIAVTGNRKGPEFAAMLERRGADPMLGPAVSGDVPNPDEDIIADTRAILDADPRWLVATTGVGMRLWAEVADRAGLGDDLRELVASCRCVARGAKATGGLVPLGSKPEWTSPNNTDHDVMSWLRTRIAPGESVAVQLHGGRTLAYDELIEDGIDLLSVLPYSWSLPDDPGPAQQVIRAAIDGEIDVITFTSPGAVNNLFTMAREMDDGTEDDLRRALAGPVAVASIGPVTAEAVELAGGINTVVPRRWRSGDLVRGIEAWWQRRHDESLELGLKLHPERSCFEWEEGEFVALGHREYAVLAALSRRPGVLVRTEDLVTEGWGHEAPADAGTVKHQIARLRKKLSETDLTIETVRGSGYRIVSR